MNTSEALLKGIDDRKILGVRSTRDHNNIAFRMESNAVCIVEFRSPKNHGSNVLAGPSKLVDNDLRIAGTDHIREAANVGISVGIYLNISD